MTTGERIFNARKAAGMTQEELAEKLNVSRQAVSKWEADAAYPETDKIVELCKLFSLSSDELLLGAEPAATQKTAPYHYEYVSKTRLFGLPLVHVNLGLGMYSAKGIIAIGNFAFGLIAFGPIAFGLIAIAALSFGLIAFGGFALGGAALGGIALGLVSFGGMAAGVLSYGGASFGYVAVGGISMGRYAMGDLAHGFVAIGKTHASGLHAFVVPGELPALDEFLSTLSPSLQNIIYTVAHVFLC